MNNKPAALLDPTERALIALLQENGRASVRHLAVRAGVTEVTVRRKLRRLLGERIVQIVAAVDPFEIGYESPVIIGLRLDRPRIEEIASKLCQHPSVRYVGAATGNYDLIVEVVAKSNHDLAQFIMGYLSSVDGILSTDTSLILKIFKQSWSWDVGEDREIAPDS